MESNIRIGALISGSGTNLQAIIDGCENGEIDGRVVFVGTDHPGGPGLQRANKHKIPTVVVDYASIMREFKKNPQDAVLPGDFKLNELLSKQTLFRSDADAEKVKNFFKSRAIAEAQLLEKISAYPFDLLVLAGFMRTLTPYFIDRVNTDRNHPRIMNIHPSLLPAFPGVDGYGDTFRYGCKVGGCTVHFVDYGEDTGPIIGQRAFEFDVNDTVDTVRKKGLKLEWDLYPHCIQLYARGRLKTVTMSFDLPNGKKMERRVVRILD